MIKYRWLYMGIALIVLFAALTGGCGKSADKTQKPAGEIQKPAEESQKTWTLKLASYAPVTNLYYKEVAAPFVEEVEKRSNGRIKIETFPGGQLGTGTELLRVAQTGGADIIHTAATYLPQDLPLLAVFAIPGIYTDDRIGVRAMWLLSQQETPFRKELEKQGVKALATYSGPVADIFTAKRQIKTVKDLKGLLIRTYGGASDEAINLAGAKAVTMPLPEVYMSLQRGLIDGNVANYGSADAAKFYEVEKFATVGGAAQLSAGFNGLFIKSDKFDALPKDLQALLLEVGEKISKDVTEVQYKTAEEAQEKFKKEGVTLTPVSEEFKAEFAKLVAPVKDKWIKSVNALGYNGEELIKLVEKAMKDAAASPFK